MCRWRRYLLMPAAWALLACPAAGQAEADAVLNGRVLLGGANLDSGTVVLHVLSDLSQGEVDSVGVAPDGSFALPLPRVPDPGSGEFFFASVRHDGVMYFGPPISMAIQLDSLYEIQAYDTLMAPPDGLPIALQARNVFMEQTVAGWQITDLFQLRSDQDRTIVPRPGGITWRYPLPEGAREVATSEELSADVATYEDGDLVVRAALPPGERLFIVRYLVDPPEISIPTPGETEMLDLLVREPAPVMEVEGLLPTETVELDPGERFRRYAGENISTPVLRIALGEEERPPPVQWVAVIIALVLAGGGVLALRAGGRAQKARSAREAILVEVARLDEEFESSGSTSKKATRRYRQRREDLMRRLRED